MRRGTIAILSAVAFSLSGFQSHAETLPKDNSASEYDFGAFAERLERTINTDICSVRGDNAQKIMELRQSGVAMSVIMKKLKDNESFHNVIVSAYRVPRYSSKSFRIKAAEDFRNVMELECYEAGLDQNLVPVD